MKIQSHTIHEFTIGNTTCYAYAVTTAADPPAALSEKKGKSGASVA